MIQQESKDSLPCLVEEQQKILYIFSQPRHIVPSYLKALASSIKVNGKNEPDSSQTQSPHLIDMMLHHVSISVGQKVLFSDVSVFEITDFVLPSTIGKVRFSHFFITPSAVNGMLEAASLCMLQTGGIARCTNHGIVYCRDMRGGEVFYQLEISRTPLPFSAIMKSFGHYS